MTEPHDPGPDEGRGIAGRLVYAPSFATVDACLRDGRLQEGLPAWSSDGEAFHVYYPSRRQQSEALKFFIAMLRHQLTIPAGG